jgi:hypothetical protein
MRQSNNNKNKTNNTSNKINITNNNVKNVIVVSEFIKIIFHTLFDELNLI